MGNCLITPPLALPLPAFSLEGFQEGNAMLYLCFSNALNQSSLSDSGLWEDFGALVSLLAPPVSSQILPVLTSLSPFLLLLKL